MATAALFAVIVLAAPTERVLAIHTPSGDISARQAGLFEAHLRLELAKHQGLEVVRRTPGDAETPDSSCVEKPTCLTQLAKGVGADIVVFARTARLQNDSVVTMKRLRIVTGEIEQTTTRSLSGGDGQEMLIALGPMVAELFPDRPIVSGNMTGVTRDDVVRWTPPPVKPWMFWTAAGATVAGAACIAVFAIQKSNAESDFRELTQQDVVAGLALKDAADRANAWKNRTNVAIGATAGLAITTAILGYFTDWDRGRDTELLVGPTGGALRTSF
jgi:hypothetical protein